MVFVCREAAQRELKWEALLQRGYAGSSTNVLARKAWKTNTENEKRKIAKQYSYGNNLQLQNLKKKTAFLVAYPWQWFPLFSCLSVGFISIWEWEKALNEKYFCFLSHTKTYIFTFSLYRYLYKTSIQIKIGLLCVYQKYIHICISSVAHISYLHKCNCSSCIY